MEQPEDLGAAFTTIASSIARCSFVVPRRLSDADSVPITVDGVEAPRDPSHMEGPDWTDASEGEVTVFGSVCAAASAGPVTVRATIECGDGG